MQRVLVHIKTQVENPQIPGRGFTLDQIMYLHISFHELALTLSNLHAELHQWLALKKVVINPKYNDEECFKWTVITVFQRDWEQTRVNIKATSL